MCRASLAGRTAPASADGGARWSPSTRPATASTPLPPPRPPSSAVPGQGKGAQGAARGAVRVREKRYNLPDPGVHYTTVLVEGADR
eukprot:scaffold6204_cov56-Phaeocystis_antarctica.AAC.2